jgi:hypothetical protein
MESAEKHTSMKGKELRGLMPHGLPPHELSERPDSSNLLRGDRRKARQVLSVGKPAAEDKASLVVLDEKAVDKAAKWISAKVAATLKLGAQEVGEYVLDTFFGGDPNLAKSKNPFKHASFRALAEKCGTPELPVSKTWLSNAVGVALMIRQLPETAKAFRELPPSYQETLLPLGDPTTVEKVAKEAVAKDLSFRELRHAVAAQRTKMPKDDSRKGRSPTPVIVKTLTRSLKLFTLEGGKRSFTKAQIEELDDEQRKDAIASAEGLIEKLKDLVSKLSKT